MINSNTTNTDNCDSALHAFMRNVLHIQDHADLHLVDDNAKSPTHSPMRKHKETRPIFQFTTASVQSPRWSKWPTSPTPINGKSKLGMNHWGDLHYEPQQRQLREEKEPPQSKKRTMDSKKIASNQRFCTSVNQSNDRPLPSSVIGGHVAMLRQNSLERHFMAVAAKDDSNSSSLATVPEDESVNGDHDDEQQQPKQEEQPDSAKPWMMEWVEQQEKDRKKQRRRSSTE